MDLLYLETIAMRLFYTNINQMKKRSGMDSIWRVEKGQWWENIRCIINCVQFVGNPNV